MVVANVIVAVVGVVIVVIAVVSVVLVAVVNGAHLMPLKIVTRCSTVFTSIQAK